MFYPIFRALANMTLKLFFQQIEVEGRSNVPASGPVLLIANHSNSLVDPLLPLTRLDRHITLTAKNVLYKNPLLAILFRGLNAIAFHRAEDVKKGASPRENVRSMQKCRDVLAGGGVVCIFPEGISHSDLQLREFHNGAAKIALDFARKDGGSLIIVPVGLLYTSKDQFRSNVWLRFGEPVSLAAWLKDNPDAASDALTASMRSWIEQITVNYEDRREMLLVNWASTIAATGGKRPLTLGSSTQSVSESFRRIARVQAGYRQLQNRHSEEVSALSARMLAFRQSLRKHGASPAEVFIEINPVRATLFLARELELVFIGFPLALLGVINHLIPLVLVRILAIKLSKDRDHWATNVVYPTFIILPLTYLSLLTCAWMFLPWIWALLYTIILPYSGMYALLYTDRVTEAWRRTRAFTHFLFDRKGHDALVQEGREILASLTQLAAKLPAKDQP